jgi:hypothetical protein
MTNTNLKLVKEGPYGFLVEKEPIKVAAILAEDQKKGFSTTSSNHWLLNCVLMDPHYIPEGFTDYKEIEVIGRRLGRTIDVLMDEPITVEETGKEYKILTYKGCGAFPEYCDQWVIDPFRWRSIQGNQLGRMWGALYAQSAILEAKLDFSELEKFGIDLTPYVFANRIPKEVLEEIYRGEEITNPLGQALRLCETNILYSDIIRRATKGNVFTSDGTLNNNTIDEKEVFKYINQDEFITRTLALIENSIEAQRYLHQKEEKLAWIIDSELISNAYISGELKDFENIVITDQNDQEGKMTSSIFSELMSYLGEKVLSRKGSFRVFPNITTVDKYIESGKEGPIILTNEKEIIHDSEKSLYVLNHRNENVRPFAIVGYYNFDEEQITWDSESIDTYCSVEEAIGLDKKLREEGYRVAKLSHLMLANKTKMQRYLWNSTFCNVERHHTLVLLDRETNTLYDNLEIKEGKISLTNARERIVSNPTKGIFERYNQHFWPRFENKIDEYRQIGSYEGGKSNEKSPPLIIGPNGEGLTPVTFALEFDCQIELGALNTINRFKPLIVKEY